MIRLDAFVCNYHNRSVNINNNGNCNSCATLPHDATRHGPKHSTEITFEVVTNTRRMLNIFYLLVPHNVAVNFVNQFSFSHSIWCRLYLPVVFARLSTEWIRDAGSAAIAQKRQPRRRRSVSVSSDSDSEGSDNSNDDSNDDSNCDSVCERAQRPTDSVKVMMFLAGNGKCELGIGSESQERRLFGWSLHGGGGWPQDEPGDDDDDDRLLCLLCVL